MKNITYTKTGDEGKTSLIGGLRVAKYDDRVEAYGTVDELSAFIGVLYDQEGVTADMKGVMDTVQNKLFTIESHFALDENSEVKKMIPVLTPEDVAFLEHEIDMQQLTFNNRGFLREGRRQPSWRADGRGSAPECVWV